MDILEMFVAGEGVRKVVDAEEAQVEIDAINKKLNRCQKRNHQKNVDIHELLKSITGLDCYKEDPILQALVAKYEGE